MKKLCRSGINLTLVAASLIFASTTSLAAEKFTGRIITGGTGSLAPVLNFRVSIEKYSSPADTLKLARVLNENGVQPFMKAFRKTNNGTFQLTGGPGLSVTIHATNSVTTDKGRRVQLFCERQNWDSDSNRQRMAGAYFFMVVELDVDAEERGTGKLYPAAEIQINAEGTIEMKSYDAAPWVIIDLRSTT